MEYKKNAVDLTDLAIGIIVLGIVVTIGTVIILNVRDGQLADLSQVTYSENITGSNTTGTTLAKTWYASLGSVVNATNWSQTVPAANYTITTDAATGYANLKIVDSGAATAWNAKSIKVTYNYYNTSSPNWQVANDAALGLGEYGNWFDIIVIVGVAAVILSLIFMAFGRRGSETTQAY